ncbi:MAG: hypothetical protein GXO43_05845 [Crenarchaeota archaeon]|nr:hypothetical protein [Thermoproteota archaeon]
MQVLVRKPINTQYKAQIPRQADIRFLGQVYLDPETVAETPDGKIVVVALPVDTQGVNKPRSIYYLVIDLDTLAEKGIDKAVVDKGSLSTDPLEALKKYMRILKKYQATPPRRLVDIYELSRMVPRTQSITMMPSRTALEYAILFNSSGHQYGESEGFLDTIRDTLALMRGEPLLKPELLRHENGITWIVTPGAKAPFLGATDFLEAVEKLGKLEPLELPGRGKGYLSVVKALRERGRDLGGWSNIVAKWIQLVGKPLKAYILYTEKPGLYPEYLVLVGKNGKTLLVKTWKTLGW